MLRHPYSVLFYTLISKLALWQYESKVPGKTEWVFDDQGPVGAETVVWYSHMKSLEPLTWQRNREELQYSGTDILLYPFSTLPELMFVLRREVRPRRFSEARPAGRLRSPDGLQSRPW